jgi:hypothetical protein
MKYVALFTVMACLRLPVFARNTIRPLKTDDVRVSESCFLAASCVDYQRAFHALILWSVSLWFIFGCVTVYADVQLPDRRKDQFPTSPAHLVVPLPYSYPGIGQGFFLMGNFSNVMDTTTDFLAIYVTGDAGGYVLQLDEAPIIDRRLYARIFYQNINRAVVNQYDIRGMSGSGKDDYTLLDISLALQKSARFDLTFFDRRLDFFFTHTDSVFDVQAVRDHNGNLISQLADPYHGEDSSQILGVSVDLTDDYLDPLKGLRFGMDYRDRPAKTAGDASYYVLTYNTSLYLPMHDTDTLVFNYFQSDAHVTTKGDTNPADIRAELGLNCAPSDAACLQSEQKLVDTFINQRTNGTAQSLGGKERLRSYPEGRFNGGHSAFLGVEYRWNFKQEAAPFNYLFWKDVRTGLQVAFFGEVGSVSETSTNLWNETRTSYGTGLRLVAASGAVYRADIAYGSEGSETTVFFFYPW